MTSKLNDIRISASSDDFKEQIARLHDLMITGARFGIESKEYKAVLAIERNVAEKGDQAVIDYTSEFDNVDLTADQLRVTSNEIEQAHRKIGKDLLASIRQAIANVRKYQEEIFKYQEEIFEGKSKHPGIKYRPSKRVGLCVPGASAPLTSTVIMTAIPAQVAGVEEIAVVSPPKYNKSIHPVTLAVCHELEIDDVYRVGGAQAVAAMAHGTETIGQVDKIVGPGNKWVQTAKKMVFGYVGIDSVAGPSEVLIIADDSANPAWVAADMLSQAEHAPGSAVVFTDSQALGDSVFEELQKQVKQLSRAEDTTKCLNGYSLIAVFKNMDDIIKEANNFASEHLEIQCKNSRDIADKIDNAGAIFIGAYSPVAVGDYWAGPSHTLPTGQTARFFSALSSNDFVKSTSIIEYDKEMLEQSADDIIRLAQTEGLDAHAKSIQIRQKN